MDFRSKKQGGRSRPIRTSQNINIGNNCGPYPMRANPVHPNHQNRRRNEFRQGQRQGMGRDSQLVRCYNCSGYGHISRNCPHPGKDGQMGYGNQPPQQYQNFGKQPMQQNARPTPLNNWNRKQPDKAHQNAKGPSLHYRPRIRSRTVL